MAAEYGVQKKFERTGGTMRIANGLTHAAALALVEGLRTPKAQAQRIKYWIVKERS